MVKRKKAIKEEYEFLAIEVSGYKARVDASINYEVRDKRHYYKDANVYSFATHLEIEGVCIYPEGRTGDAYRFTINGYEPQTSDFKLKLSDCHIRDDEGRLKFRKVRGKEIPVYDVPKGIGYIEKQRGINVWNAYAWVSPQSATDMLSLLPNVCPMYISVQELKIARNRWIVSMTLQTSDPAEE